MAIEPATEEAQGHDFEAHARDYSGFIRLFKYTAIAALVTALLVMMIIS